MKENIDTRAILYLPIVRYNITHISIKRKNQKKSYNKKSKIVYDLFFDGKIFVRATTMTPGVKHPPIHHIHTYKIVYLHNTLIHN